MAADTGAAETRQSSSGAAQPLLPEPPEGGAWSMQDLAARCVCTLPLTFCAAFIKLKSCHADEKGCQGPGPEGCALQ